MKEKLKTAYILTVVALVCIIIAIILFATIGVLGVLPLGIGCYLFFIQSLPVFIQYNRAKRTVEKVLSLPTEKKQLILDRPYIRIEPKSLDEQISYKYRIANSPIVKYLCDMVINATDFYNKKNNSNISRESVADMLFEKQGTEIEKMTLNEVKNAHLGFFTFISIYCILLSDKAYSKMKYHNETFNKLEFHIEGYSSAELKKRFLSIMDDCYIAWHINSLNDENIQSFDDLNNQLDGKELFDITLLQFMKEYHQTDNSFLKYSE